MQAHARMHAHRVEDGYGRADTCQDRKAAGAFCNAIKAYLLASVRVYAPVFTRRPSSRAHLKALRPEVVAGDRERVEAGQFGDEVVHRDLREQAAPDP